MTTPATSRHLAPLPPSTLRPSPSTELTQVSATAEAALLAHDRVRVLTAEITALTSRLKEHDVTARESTTKILLLERELGTAKREKREVEAQLGERDRRVQKLEADRGVVEGRKDEDEKERRDAVKKAEEEARQSKQSEREAREELEAVHAANESLERELREVKHASSQRDTRSRAAEERAVLLEQELAKAMGESQAWRTKCEAEAQAREEAEARVNDQVKDEKETESANILREELRRQVTHLKTLETSNARMTRELAAFKSHQTNTELLKEQNRNLSSQLSSLDSLRTKLSSAEAALAGMERERAEWQAYLETDEGLTFSGPSALSKALAAARIESVSMKDRLGARDAEIKARDRLVGELEEQMNKLEQEKEDELEKRRRAEGAAERAERGRELDKRRAEMLAEQLKSYAREEATLMAERRSGAGSDEADGSDAAAGKKHLELQVGHLEELLEAHKKELAEVNKEASRLRGLLEAQGGRTMDIAGVLARGEDETEPPTSPVKTSLAAQIQRIEDLEKECDELADENDLLNKTVKSLELQIDHLSLALGRGEFNVATTKVLELEGSPAQRDLAVRTSTLEALKSENRALLDKLSQLEKRRPSADGTSAVPLESLEALRTEVGQLQADLAQKEIARDRLSKAFATKAREFREAVHSLLGYKLDFEPDGRVRVRSVFAPSDDYSLVFKSGQGNMGTMALVGGGNAAFNVSQEVRTQMRFWVTERGCIPGFLASLTIELFEGTTRGRMGGFVA